LIQDVTTFEVAICDLKIRMERTPPSPFVFAEHGAMADLMELPEGSPEK
jgi:hypothetical protein